MKDIKLIRAASPKNVLPIGSGTSADTTDGGQSSQESRQYRDQRTYSTNSEGGNESDNSSPSTYYSFSGGGSGTDESVETNEYADSKTFDHSFQRSAASYHQTAPLKSTGGAMLVATPSSIYTIHPSSESAHHPATPSPTSTDLSTPRQRRLTCAQRMVMINQKQQQQQTPRRPAEIAMRSEGGSCSDATSAATHHQVLSSSRCSSPSIHSTGSVKIYMQSVCKAGGRPVAFSSQKDANARMSSVEGRNRPSSGQLPSYGLSQRTTDSTKIMEKLLSPVGQKQQEPKQLNVVGQRINVNDLLRDCSDFQGTDIVRPAHPTVVRPNSSEIAGSIRRQPLSRALISPPLNLENFGNGNFRDRNCSAMERMRSSGFASPPYRPSTTSVQNTNYKRRSPPDSKSPINRTPFAHQAFGEFKLFKDQQQANPMKLHVNQRRNVHGPTGIPAVDCSNGYRSYSDHHLLGDPMDPELATDFDFAGNLALFDKAEFNRKTERIFDGLDSSCDHSRNYRNDENVLEDATRVISWTKSANTNDENRNTSSSSPAD